jgi:hypothetical protein
MRKAALFAGIAQLLFGVFTVAPGLFAVGRSPASSQPLDWAFGSFILVGSSIFAIFFFSFFRTPAPNLGGAVRIASLIAAAALTGENLLPTYNTIWGALTAANHSLGWRYHPLKQFAYVIAPTIPTLVVVSLVAFLLLVFSMSLRTQDLTQCPKHRTDRLRLISLAAATVSLIGVACFLYFAIAAPGPLASSVSLFLRFATLSSLTAFFWVFGMNQRPVAI